MTPPALHLVRLPVDRDALARAAGARGWTTGRRQNFDEGAALHHLLGETFGPAALQPFRLIAPPRRRTGSLYAYTGVDPAELVETAALAAMPEVVAALSPASLETKPMPTVFPAGRRVGIDVRLRPTVRLLRDVAPPPRGGHGFRRGAEIDAFLAEALKHEDRGAMEAAGRTREAVYRDWLASRLQGVACVEDVRLAAFRRTLAARGGTGQDALDVTLHGTIRVEDPERFATCLRRGLGRHRAYGYGMLLLRPPAPAREA
ncbi:type I-E CRISPR-associated protein Cas6/Cse3/CasE [Methylobacterium thuringiense]|uniref:Type I-E CRISPR-associated protein Cas6/Cse3/CasE n=1 Tax=Methylobacterium thuringiense TaxID=1003091 RepID=A0ABQ4TRC3_9HYPH|nr:type I-E CRISPR-associated protein Cas6/Cse3/CasE [Methylobacterium thuringiense]GJE57841.1 hypothetical protein EKPJFOCH_4363 [Methylobacterium thuringiense]